MTNRVRSTKELIDIIGRLEDYANSCRAMPVEDINQKIGLANDLLKELDHKRERSNKPSFVREVNMFRKRTAKTLQIMLYVKNKKLKEGGETE